MLPSQIRFLKFSSATPDTSVGDGIYDCVILKGLILGRYNKTRGTDDAIGGYSDGVMNPCSWTNGVEIADCWALDSCNG